MTPYDEDELFLKPSFCSQVDLEITPEIFSNSFHDKDPWIQTYSGVRFDPLNPTIDSICIEDISQALSLQCRFSGHSKFHYSVAQHSLLTSYLVSKQNQLHALLHDASEAYLVDLPTPLKLAKGFESYLIFEKKLEAVIAEKFGLTAIMPEEVRAADKMMLATEARDLIAPRPDWKFEYSPLPFSILQMSPEEAKMAFLKRFEELRNNAL